MTEVPAMAQRPTIPVFRTAYDAYRLERNSIFSGGKAFRFFLYGSVISAAEVFS